MKKKNWILIVIILVAVLLIATVIWIYSKRIEHIESKMNISAIHILAEVARKMIPASLLIPNLYSYEE